MSTKLEWPGGRSSEPDPILLSFLDKLPTTIKEKILYRSVSVVLSLVEGNATTRFHQSRCWFSHYMAARRARAAASDAGDRLPQ